MVTRRKTPKFYFSLRSPYSWLAYRDLRHHHPDLALPGRMEWLPYYEPDAHSERLLRQIGGELPYAEMNRAKHMYILQDVGRLAEARGIELSWPVDREPVWEIPHLGFLVAHREGRGLEYVDAVYRARWEECRRGLRWSPRLLPAI